MQYHICLCSDNAYIDKAAVVIYSTILSVSQIQDRKKDFLVFHVFHNGLSKENLQLIRQFDDELNQIYPSKISLYFISDENIQNFKRWGENSSLATYLRLFIPDNLGPDVDKILYLDCDILCVGDIRPLFHENMNSAVVACAPDPWVGQKDNFIFRSKKIFGMPVYLKFTKTNCYFNAGVLLIDLKKWRELKVSEKCLELIHTKRLPFNDQDALNIVLLGQTKLIETRWNFIGTTNSTIFKKGLENCLSKKSSNITKLIQPLLTAINLDNIVIIHYAGSPKPWNNKFSFVEDGNLRLIDPILQSEYCKIAKNAPIFGSKFSSISANQEEYIIEAVNALGKWTKSIEKKSQRRWKKVIIILTLFFFFLLMTIILLLTNL